MNIKNGANILKQLPNSHKGSVLYTTVDNEGNYAVSIGCDGYAHIYNIKEEEIQMEESAKVSYEMTTEKEFVMKCEFNKK